MTKFYVYFMTQRPPLPGTMPRSGLVSVTELDVGKTYVPCICMDAYAKLTYTRKLDQREIRDYELVPEFSEIVFTRAEMLKLKEIVWQSSISGKYTKKELNALWSVNSKLNEALSLE